MSYFDPDDGYPDDAGVPKSLIAEQNKRHQNLNLLLLFCGILFLVAMACMVGLLLTEPRVNGSDETAQTTTINAGQDANVQNGNNNSNSKTNVNVTIIDNKGGCIALICPEK